MRILTNPLQNFLADSERPRQGNSSGKNAILYNYFKYLYLLIMAFPKAADWGFAKLAKSQALT
jgi:hypothetical protein